MATNRRTAADCAMWVKRVLDAGSIAAAARRHSTPRSTVKDVIDDARMRDPLCLPDVFRGSPSGWAHESWAIPARVPLDVAGKTVLVGGDLHVWPGPVSLAWRAMVAVAHDVMPDVIVLGGDMIDGARVSRHARILGSRAPKLSEEIDALRAHLDMLPPCWFRAWVIGNHDLRVDNYLAEHASELEDYAGSLRDRFQEWEVAYAFSLGQGAEIRHRFRGGIHAAWNNVLHSGISMASFHTHQQGIKTMDDRNGRRYGVEPGCLADPAGPQFEYAEGSPSRSAMGFALLTFDDDGMLLPPELCEHSAGRMIFRGRVVAGEKPRVRVKARSAVAVAA